MKARLFVLSGTAIGSLVLAAATTAAGGGSAVTPIAEANGSAWRLLRLGVLDSSDTSPSWNGTWCRSRPERSGSK
jgi:hypothetical protein